MVKISVVACYSARSTERPFHAVDAGIIVCRPAKSLDNEPTVANGGGLSGMNVR